MRSIPHYLLILILNFLVLEVSYAQVQTRYAKQPILSDKGVFSIDKPGPIIVLPEIDLAQTLKEDSVETGMDVPFRFGYAIDVNYTLSNAGSWFDSTSGRIWKLSVKSPKAYSINFIFEELSLPDGAELYIYNQSKTMVYGPLTPENTGKSGSLGTDLIQGEQVTLELFEPRSQQGKSRLKIAKTIHGYKDVFYTPDNFGNAMECHNNINCPSFSNWLEQSNSVAMVLLAGGTRLCSGALLNNTAGDFTPNFLTAFHCIDIGDNMDPCETEAGNGELSPTEINRAQNWVFRFQYKSPTCTPSTEPATWITFNGSTYRAGWADTDFALLEMNTDPIPCVEYAGWSRSTAAPSSGAGIHHPRGDVMKISTYNSSATSSNAITWDIGGESCPNKTRTTPANTYWTVTLTDGTTEGGSSGSPLFDQNKRVVGQLHGGHNGCAPIVKYYGKLDRSWGKDASGNFLTGRNANNSLAPWLDPNNTGLTTTNTERLLSISGPATFCTSGTYTISNLPAGATVTSWTASPSLGISISGSGSSVTVTKTGTFGSSTTLNANIETSCGNMTVSKGIYAGTKPVSQQGPFDPATHTIVGVICAGKSYYFKAVESMPPAESGTTYNWTLTPPPESDLLPMSFAGEQVTVPFNIPGTYELQLRKNNSCGESFSSSTLQAQTCY